MDILAFTCDMSREEFKLPNLFKDTGEKPGKYQCYLPPKRIRDVKAFLGSQYLDGMSHLVLIEVKH